MRTTDGTASTNNPLVNKLLGVEVEVGKVTVDTGIVSSNIEKKFGISAIYEKFPFISPEIKENFNLEQAEFQSLISGENSMIKQTVNDYYKESVSQSHITCYKCRQIGHYANACPKIHYNKLYSKSEFENNEDSDSSD